MALWPMTLHNAVPRVAYLAESRSIVVRAMYCVDCKPNVCISGLTCLEWLEFVAGVSGVVDVTVLGIATSADHPPLARNSVF